MNALANGDQRFLALTSSRAPGDVIEPLGNFSPVRGSSGGSTLTSLHTSSNISAMRSLRELYQHSVGIGCKVANLLGIFLL